MVANTTAEFLVPTGIYKHYKGQLYQVLHCGRHSETEEWFVIYQCLYGDFSIWIRPMSMFQEKIILENGQQTARFSPQNVTSITA
jgi:hypothetical protein